jgi:hypothetical protein
MDEPDRKYWFPAKRYGWGWSLPLTRQGWVVMILWTLVVIVVAPLLRPNEHPVRFGLFVAAMIGVLLAICYAKGEPPRWRWGDQDDGTTRGP